MKDAPSKILMATHNQGKVKEIRDLIKGHPVVFLSLSEVGDISEVIEDGETFEENALKKARSISAATGLATLADDSGLCVDALDGRPGVRSARYAGDNTSDEQKYFKILEEMRDVPEKLRSARFVCVLAFVTPDGTEELFRGTCEGQITHEPMGKSGFGYDPIFFFEKAGRTFGQMDRHSKNLVSHRGHALMQFADYLKSLSSPVDYILD